MNGPEPAEPAPRSDEPETPAPPETPAMPEVPAAPGMPPPPGAPASPDAAAAGPEAAHGYGAPPGTAAVPADPSLVAPAPPTGRNVVGMAFGAAAVAVLAGVLVFALIHHLNSTASVRAIIPAPAAAGGLNQDYADEHSGQFRSVVSALDQNFRATMPSAKFGAAIYTNAPAGSPARGASIVVVYLGINAPSSDNSGPFTSGPASTVKSALSGIGSELTHATLVQEGGGPGDTRYACETGQTTSSYVVICAWSTDDTIGMLIPQVPVSSQSLAALMKKMEPDLVRG